MSWAGGWEPGGDLVVLTQKMQRVVEVKTDPRPQSYSTETPGLSIRKASVLEHQG